MFQGTVKWFNYDKGYGFIEPSDKTRDVFLHVSALEQSNIRNINEGQKVSYKITSEKGKDSAVDIKLI